MIELNLDGLVGPTHNYAGLSHGNLASHANAGAVSRPRAAALQGLAKMRLVAGLGLPQGFLLPHDRPDVAFLRTLGFGGADEAVLASAARNEPGLLATALSASAMWTANAATVSPAPDTADGRCHLTVANLSTMAHRALEPAGTLRQLRAAFGEGRFFAVHPPVPAAFGDEGAANHMRLAPAHGEPGVEVFVHGASGGPFPARQHRRASEGVARLHGLDPARTLHIRQSAEAIAAGAFHNDVVAVANGPVLFAHEQAFAHREAVLRTLASVAPWVEVVEVPAAAVSLADAVATYLFNAQLVTLPGEAGMALVLPAEAEAHSGVWRWLRSMAAGNGPIRRLEVVDLRESMRNGGGPACLRLRVALGEDALAAVDPRFLLSERNAAAIERAVEQHWPAEVAPADLGHSDYWREVRAARAALLAALGFAAGEV